MRPNFFFANFMRTNFLTSESIYPVGILWAGKLLVRYLSFSRDQIKTSNKVIRIILKQSYIEVVGKYGKYLPTHRPHLRGLNG